MLTSPIFVNSQISRSIYSMKLGQFLTTQSSLQNKSYYYHSLNTVIVHILLLYYSFYSRRMELKENQTHQQHSDNEDYEVCELMTDSAVQQNLDLPEESEIDQKVPSIIRNLEQAETKHNTRISEILGSFSCDLYEEQMKTIRTLGIIPQEKSQIESSHYISKKFKTQQDDISTKFTATQSYEAANKFVDQNFSPFASFSKSQIGETALIFKLRKESNPDKSLSLFKNYLLRNKMQIFNESYNTIIAQIKPKVSNLSMFIQSVKSIQDIHLCVNLIPAVKCLKMSLSCHPRNSLKSNKYINELRNHAHNFREYLWENNCIEVSQSESIDLTFNKEKQSITQLKKVIKTIVKQNKKQTGLHNSLVKTLEMRELLMFQLEQKSIQFHKSDPFIEVEKKLLIELQLYKIFENYYVKNQQIYQQKRKIILSKYQIQDLYEYLKIPQNQRLRDQDEDFPYDTALQQLQNFFQNPFPHLSLVNIERFYNNIELCKQANSKFAHPTEESQSNVIGLVILCLVHAKTKNIYHKVRFIDNYLRVTDNSKYQKMCMNLSLGIDYIQSAWQIKG